MRNEIIALILFVLTLFFIEMKTIDSYMNGGIYIPSGNDNRVQLTTTY